MKLLSQFLVAASLILLFVSPPCHARTTLRGSDDIDADELLDTVKVLLERVTALEQQNQEMAQQIATLEEYRKESIQKEERRLQESCILEDNRPAGLLIVEGCDLQIRSGGGRTDAITGTGNIILGYNELESQSTARTGSHNLVIGTGHQYRSHSGIVSGRSNSINAAAGSILGGFGNSVDGEASTISGGQGNTVRAQIGHISGGSWNMVVANEASIMGGSSNVAQGVGSAILGGKGHTEADQWGTTP